MKRDWFDKEYRREVDAEHRPAKEIRAAERDAPRQRDADPPGANGLIRDNSSKYRNKYDRYR